jgi:hypothetical protein
VSKEQRKKTAEQNEQAEKARRMRYRNTFTTPEGWQVFQEMLLDLGYFGPVETDEGKFLHNFAEHLVSRVIGTDLADRVEATTLGIRKIAERK